MPLETAPSVKQFDFKAGPNYTKLPWDLEEDELAASDNVYYDGKLKSTPYAARYLSGAMNGSSNIVSSLVVYVPKSQKRFLIGTSRGGTIQRANVSTNTWTNLATGLATGSVYWNWIVYDDKLIGASKSNVVKVVAVGGGTVSNLAGSPPNFGYLETRGPDYLLGSGHTAAPSQVRYSDTGDEETWPVGNVLNVGLDDGQIITGMKEYGDVTFIFKTRSVWILTGTSPDNFKLEKSNSDVGCVAPQTIVWTDIGIFFWSEAGPALFNGFRSFVLTDKLRSLMDDVDWTKASDFSAAYFPYLRHIVVSYTATGSSYPNKTLVIDLRNLAVNTKNEKLPQAIWPMTTGIMSMTSGKASTTNPRADLFLGFRSGHVCQYNSGTNFNSTKLTPRIRSRGFNLEGPDRVYGHRALDIWTVPDSNTVTLKVAVNGGTFATQADTPYSNTGSNALKLKRVDGDGSGNYYMGRHIQYQVTASTAAHPFTLIGFEGFLEPASRRHDGA